MPVAATAVPSWRHLATGGSSAPRSRNSTARRLDDPKRIARCIARCIAMAVGLRPYALVLMDENIETSEDLRYKSLIMLFVVS